MSARYMLAAAAAALALLPLATMAQPLPQSLPSATTNPSALASPGPNAADSVLGVEAVSGDVSVEHLGTRITPGVGARLRERDVIRTGPDGRLTMRFARLGFLELGPNSQAGVEKLPFASYATDLKSIFSLSRGYLRVVWKHLPTSTAWPLYVYVGGQRAGLGAGEYFFDQGDAGTRVCVAAGQLAVVPVTGEAVDTLRPPSCSKLTTTAAPDTTARDPDDWIAVRREFAIDANARTPVSATAAAAAGFATRNSSEAPPVLAGSGPMPSLSDALSPSSRAATAKPAAAPAPALTTPSPPLARVTKPAAPAPAPVAASTAAAPFEPIEADGDAGAAVASATPARRASAEFTPAPIPAPAAPPVAASPPVVASALPAQTTTPRAAATAAPVDLPPAADAARGSWSINVASYPEAESASTQVRQLAASGYSAATAQVSIGGRTWYRVQIRGFATAEAARTKAAELQEKHGYRNLWVVRQ